MQLFKIEKQNFFLFGSRKIWKSFPHIGKVFVKLGQNFGQNFTIFSKNQKQCQLPGVGLISKYRSLIEGQLKIGIEVNLNVEDQSDTKQKWDLAKDKRTDWIKLKKPNGFFLESSECGNDLIIQGMYILASV